MKRLTLAGAAGCLFALAACGSDGAFKNPLTMSMEEKCANAQLLLAVAQANDVDASAIETLATNVALFCPAPPAP